jgi:AraC-like DNA-binding protein
MISQEKDQCRLIVRPRYSIACADLPAAHPAEQIAFEYTIYHMVRGAAELLLDNRTCTIESSGYIFIPPGRAYLLRSASDAARALSIRIKREMFVEIATDMGFDCGAGELFFLSDTAPDIPALSSLCETMMLEAESGLAGQHLVLDAVITQVAIFLLRGHMGIRQDQQMEISRVGVVDRRLRRAIEYIHAHYNRDLSLAEIAESAFLSEYHFARLFKRLTGLTPHQYMAAVRIEQAKIMLAETDQTIVSISLAVGYASQSHFTKIFRNFVGFTPVEYRELNTETKR